MKKTMTYLIASVIAVLMGLASARVFAFDAYVNNHFYGIIEVTIVDTQAPALHCLPWIIAVECVGEDGPNQRKLYTPLSFGPGQIIGIIGALSTPLHSLGHGTRHVFEGPFHPQLFPFIDLPE